MTYIDQYFADVSIEALAISPIQYQSEEKYILCDETYQHLQTKMSSNYD